MDNDLYNDLVKPIDQDEILKIVMKSPKNKIPGMDGYTNEFYQAFWPYIGKYVTASFNEALEEGELGTSQKRGMISLIPKAQKDPEEIKNWRPITLLNCD